MPAVFFELVISAMIKKIECAACVPYDYNCPSCGDVGSDGQYEVLSGLKMTDENGVEYFVRFGYRIMVNTSGQSIAILQSNGLNYDIRLSDTIYNTLQELAAAACACNGSATSGGGTELPTNLQAYNSDLDAQANGIALYSFYIAGPGHMDASYGTVKMRMV